MTETSSTDAADRAIRFFGKYVVNTKGEWAGTPLKLEPWQVELLSDLFGTLNPDGRRQYRTSLIGIPRKNGKSTLGAGIALKLLFSDDEPGAEVYSAAADREQARIVFEMARGMVEANENLSKIAKVYRNSIVVPRTGSTYKVLSADAFTKHGLNPHGIVFDELHAQPNRELWDVLTTGQGARRQPLTVAITTAGFDRQSLCYELYEYGQKINAGLLDDPTFYFRWYGAAEGDAWDDPATWEKANPNLDVSISRSFLESESRQAKHLPERQNTFIRLYTNVWTSANERWIDLTLWDENAGMVDEPDLADRRCYGGLDLASTSDFSAWVLVFPGDDGVTVLPRFFLPEAALEKRSAMRPTLERWKREGWLTVTPGDVTDFATIEAQILRDAERFQLVEFAFDPWQSELLRQRLADQGLLGYKCPQGMAHMSGPAKHLERLLGERRVTHGGNPVLRWMVDNTQATRDANDHIKPDRKRSTEKIDGVVALVMALAAAYREQDLVMAPPEVIAL